MSVWYEGALGDEYWMGSSADAGLGNVTMTITVSAVPEPATYGLLLAGWGCWARWRVAGGGKPFLEVEARSQAGAKRARRITNLYSFDDHFQEDSRKLDH